MKIERTGRGRSGFTLIEILVVLILLAILAAAVFPLVTQQTGTADPVRVANDLASIKTGVQQFRLDMRPEFPGDLEDLAFRPSGTVEAGVDGTVYGTTLVGEWNGPYIDAALVEEDPASAQETGNAFATGYSAQIQYEIECFNRTNNTETDTTCENGTHSVAAVITGLSADMFSAIDAVIDGASSTFTGNFRLIGPNAYYFLAPYH